MRVKEAEGALEGTGGGALNEEDQEEEEGVFFPLSTSRIQMKRLKLNDEIWVSFLVSNEPDPSLDPYELAAPLSVTSSLPPDFYTNLSSSKWKDRKELALEPLLSLLSQSIKYEPSSNYTELVSALAGRIMGDANVLCVVLAANSIEKLARGLRRDFERYKGLCTKELLGRTKEKKQNVLDALGNALDAVYLSVSCSHLPNLSRVELIERLNVHRHL